MGSWKDISPEERARHVAIALNEAASVDISSDNKLTVNAEGIRIIAEAIREAQEAVRK